MHALCSCIETQCTPVVCPPPTEADPLHENTGRREAQAPIAISGGAHDRATACACGGAPTQPTTAPMHPPPSQARMARVAFTSSRSSLCRRKTARRLHTTAASCIEACAPSCACAPASLNNKLFTTLVHAPRGAGAASPSLSRRRGFAPRAPTHGTQCRTQIEQCPLCRLSDAHALHQPEPPAGKHDVLEMHQAWCGRQACRRLSVQ